jgi:hypothetical protein
LAIRICAGPKNPPDTGDEDAKFGRITNSDTIPFSAPESVESILAEAETEPKMKKRASGSTIDNKGNRTLTTAS